MRKSKLKINNKDYILEMNRDTIKWLEANGFSMDYFTDKPLTYYDLLWTSLFLTNHRDVNPSLAIKLQETYKSEKGAKMVAKVIKFAVDEYKAFMTALADTDSTESEEELEIIET